MNLVEITFQVNVIMIHMCAEAAAAVSSQKPPEHFKELFDRYAKKIFRMCDYEGNVDSSLKLLVYCTFISGCCCEFCFLFLCVSGHGRFSVQ